MQVNKQDLHVEIASIHELYRNYARIKADHNLLQRKYKSCLLSLKTTRAENKAFTENYVTKEVHDAVVKEREELRLQYHNLKNDYSSSVNELQVSYQSSCKALIDLRSEYKTVVQQCEELTLKNRNLENAKLSINQQLKEENEDLTRELDEFKKTYARTLKEKEQFQRGVKEYEDLKRKYASLQGSNYEFTRECDRLRHKLQALDVTVCEMRQSKLEYQRKLSALTQENEDLVKRCAGLKNECMAVAKQRDDLETQANILKTQLQQTKYDAPFDLQKKYDKSIRNYADFLMDIRQLLGKYDKIKEDAEEYQPTPESKFHYSFVQKDECDTKNCDDANTLPQSIAPVNNSKDAQVINHKYEVGELISDSQTLECPMQAPVSDEDKDMLRIIFNSVKFSVALLSPVHSPVPDDNAGIDLELLDVADECDGSEEICDLVEKDMLVGEHRTTWGGDEEDVAETSGNASLPESEKSSTSLSDETIDLEVGKLTNSEIQEADVGECHVKGSCDVSNSEIVEANDVGETSSTPFTDDADQKIIFDLENIDSAFASTCSSDDELVGSQVSKVETEEATIGFQNDCTVIRLRGSGQESGLRFLNTHKCLVCDSFNLRKRKSSVCASDDLKKKRLSSAEAPHDKNDSVSVSSVQISDDLKENQLSRPETPLDGNDSISSVPTCDDLEKKRLSRDRNDSVSNCSSVSSVRTSDDLEKKQLSCTETPLDRDDSVRDCSTVSSMLTPDHLEQKRLGRNRNDSVSDCSSVSSVCTKTPLDRNLSVSDCSTVSSVQTPHNLEQKRLSRIRNHSVTDCSSVSSVRTFDDLEKKQLSRTKASLDTNDSVSDCSTVSSVRTPDHLEQKRLSFDRNDSVSDCSSVSSVRTSDDLEKKQLSRTKTSLDRNDSVSDCSTVSSVRTPDHLEQKRLSRDRNDSVTDCSSVSSLCTKTPLDRNHSVSDCSTVSSVRTPDYLEQKRLSRDRNDGVTDCSSVSSVPIPDDLEKKQFSCTETQPVSVSDCSFEDCPASPDPSQENLDSSPLAIPFETVKRMTLDKGRHLIREMLQFCQSNDVVFETARKFLKVPPSFIAKLILQRVSTDIHTTPTKGSYPMEPRLTVVQKGLYKLMMALEKLGVDGVCTTFLQEADLYLRSLDSPILLEPVTRLYVAVCKGKSDYCQMRMAVCGVLADLGDLAVPYMYIVLQAWLEVLPRKNTPAHGHLLPKTIVQLILLKNVNTPGYNLVNLRSLLFNFYGYSSDGDDTKKLFKELVDCYLSEQNECARVLAIALSDYLSVKFVAEEAFPRLLSEASPSSSEPRLCAVITLVMHLTKHLAEKMSGSDSQTNIEWLRQFPSERYPSRVREHAKEILSWFVQSDSVPYNILEEV